MSTKLCGVCQGVKTKKQTLTEILIQDIGICETYEYVPPRSAFGDNNHFVPQHSGKFSEISQLFS